MDSLLYDVSTWAVPVVIALFLSVGFIKGLDIYSLFVEGAQEGLATGFRIVPCVIAMLVAIGIFRASGLLEIAGCLTAPLLGRLKLPADLLPMLLLRPLSGSGSLSVLADIFSASGVDSYAGLVASVMQGSTETTFYIVTVYFGAVGIKQTRYAPTVGFLADIVGFLAAAFICYRLFG